MSAPEIYKRTLLPPDCPRRGDTAAVKRSCCEPISGLTVTVRNDPHLAESYCHHCGAKWLGYFVEVDVDSPKYPKDQGPYFMPLDWLKRVLPLTINGRRYVA